MGAVFQPLPEIYAVLNEVYKAAPCLLYVPGMNNVAMILTHMLCFRQLNLSAIERLTLKYYSRSALSNFTRRSLPTLEALFVSSATIVLRKYPPRTLNEHFDR